MSAPALSHPPAAAPRIPISRRPVWASILLALVVAALRVALTRPLSFCGTPDACYYLGMAQNLAAGQGFHARFLYDFQQAHLALPNTGIEYWRPGISLLLLVLKPFGGVTLHSSIALTTLMGVFFAAAAWHLARRTFVNPWLAFFAFALCLLFSPTWVGSASPDSGLYYGAAVAWFLALFTVRRQGLWADLLALLCVCLAYLIRNDAALLLVPLLAVLWRRRVASPADIPAPGSSSRYAALMLIGFVAALAPMHLLYWRVLGTPLPSGTARTLFFNDLSDFVRYNDPATLHTLLSHGIKHLVVFRIATLLTVLYRVAALIVGYPALIFLLTLLPGRDRSPSGTPDSEVGSLPFPEATGTVAFALTTLVAYVVFLPAIGGFAALRSAVAIMPFVAVLVVLGVHRSARTPRLAVLLTGGVVLATAISGLMDARHGLGPANLIGATDREVAQELKQIGADPARSVILTNDPVQFSVTTGFAAIALPNNGAGAIAAAARDLRATHVLLDSESLPAPLDQLERELRPVRSVTLPKEHILVLQLRDSSNAR